MSYDGWHNSSAPYDQVGNINQTNPDDPHSSSYSTPYPSQYGPDRINMPYSQMPPPPVSASPTALNPGSYPDGSSWHQQPSTGRINEAVNSAFPKADPASNIPPEVLAQITANVIQQLKATGLQGQQSSSSQYQQQSQWPPPPPPPPVSDPPYSYSESPRPVNSGYTGSPPPPAHVVPDTDYPPQPRPSSTGYAHSPRSSSVRPSAVPPPAETRGSPASQASEHGQKKDPVRPHPPSREATLIELTTLEKIWGKFFVDGKPTKRLGQFLRGIALHLIEDYPPGNTIVIAPEKLQKFYEDTNVSSDPYPWQDIFDDRTSSISRLYREVDAEHHLVQVQLNERPDIPGLTPRGFQTWATLMILTHPEKEYERFQKAVLNMPISNPDDKKERFPKEIPRRLFPEVPDLALREEVEMFIRKHCSVDLPPITGEEISKAAAHRPKEPDSPAKPTSDPLPSARERGSRSSSTPNSAAVEDAEDEEVPSRPIERERKPYTAQPGGGKVYGEAGQTSRPHRESFSAHSGHRVPPPDLYTQDPSYSRTSSTGARRPVTKLGRSRSSSRGFNEYRHSEGDLTGHNGSSSRHSRMGSTGDYYMNSAATTLPGDIIEDGRRYREDDRDSEDKRLYETLREREREREKSKYHDHLPHRGSWAADDEDYYRLSSQTGGPVGGSSYDYKTYGHR